MAANIFTLAAFAFDDALQSRRPEQRLGEQPDATLEELHSWCASELGVLISTGALWSTRRRLKLTLKKSR